MSANGTGIGFVLIERLFGSEVLGHLGYSTSASSIPVSTAMAISADIALWAMPAITFYILFMGLVYSAQQGKVLGTKWNTNIVALRGVGSLMFSAPVVPGGISAIQMFVVAVIIGGNAIGNEAALLLGDGIYKPGSGYLPSSSSVAGSSGKSQAFASIVATGVCVQAAKNLGYGGPVQPIKDSPAGLLFLQNEPGKVSVEKSPSQPNPDPLSKICQQGITADNPNPGYPTDQIDCASTQYPDICNKVQNINKQYQAKVDDALKSNKGILEDKTVSDLAYSYQMEIAKAINPDYASIISKNHDAIKQLGWPGLGNYFQRYSEVSGEFDNYVYYSANPSFDFKNIGDETAAGLALHDQTAMAFSKAKNALSVGSDLSISERAAALGSGVVGGVNSEAANLINKLDHSVFTTAFRNAIFGFGHSAFDVGAFEAAQRLGALQVAMGTIGLEVIPTEQEIAMRKAGQISIEKAGPDDKALETGEGSGTVISFAKKVFQSASDAMADMGRYTAKALVFSGTVLMVVLPFVPTLFFDMQTMNWAVMIMIIAIASPIWMILHMMPDGDDLIHHQTKAGWKFLAYCFLYPTLIVLGYAAAMTALNVGIPLTFEMVMGHASPSAIGSLADIGMRPIIVSIAIMLEVLTCLGLITALPARIADLCGFGIRDEADHNKVTGAIGVQNNGIGRPDLISTPSSLPSLPGGGSAGLTKRAGGWMPKVWGKK